MQKLLVTGVTGFIGTEVLAHLVKDERCSKIVVFARKKPDREKSLLARRFIEHGLDVALIDSMDWIEVAFEDEDKFRQALEALPRHDNWRVLHMAAIIKASKENAALERLNLGVTQDLINFANDRGAPFYYMSSVSAFGASADKHVRTEDDFNTWEAHNDLYPYYSTKRAAHEYILRQAKVPGWLFCPSVVHGSLEGSKNSRAHLKSLREGRLKFAPSGGANFVALKDVAAPIADAILSGFLDGQLPQTRLLVGPNLRIVDYFNLYLDSYREFFEMRDLGLEKVAIGSVPALPAWFSKALVVTSKRLASLGLRIGFVDSLAQNSRYHYFESKYREGVALPSIDDLKEAFRASFENP